MLLVVYFFDGLFKAVKIKRTYHKTLIKGRVQCFEDAAVWFPFCFTLIALASFVVFRKQEYAVRVDLCLMVLRQKSNTLKC